MDRIDGTEPRGGGGCGSGALLAALVGWWGAALAGDVAERREAHALEALRAASASEEAPPAPGGGSTGTPPPLPYPRALRAARGIGRRRSVDLARFLWEHGPEAPIETLRGFGPTTASAARGVVEALGSGSR
ncbi:MAG: hypothetical protein AAGB93_12995 [Planctomycetota bacterium]